MAKNPNDKSSFLRRTWAEVNLDALEHNYYYLRSRIDDHVKLIAVLKADAYGHGAVEVARTLEALGADAFAVAIVDEAVALREAGVKSPIIVFGGALPGDEEAILSYHLIPAVHGFEALSRLSQLARAQGVVASYHLKVDTGMGRVGVDYRHVGKFLDQAVGLPSLRLEGVFTHLASDEASEYSALQLNRFRTCLKVFETRDIRVQMVHAAGSAGLLLLRESWFDAVRPGIALYGVNPSSNWNECELRPVLSFKTIVSLLKNLSAGTPLG
ncbi:MAG: alanine racemase, partial [Dehalococcoidia bacterium]